MSIPNDQVPKTMHVVSGADVTQFSYNFYAPDTANIYVLVDGVAVSSGWTVSSASTSEGMVEFDSPVVMGATVTVYRSTPMTQPVDLEQGDTFYPQVITEALDNVVMGMQELRGGTVNIPGEGAESAAYARSAGSANSAGYATSAGYAFSAGIAYELDSNFVANSAYHATTAAGLDSGVIVSSAAHATNADSATIANGTEYSNSAGYAFSAGVAVASGGTASFASNAAFATNAGYATNAGTAAVYGGTVGYAVFAGHADEADVASALTGDAKADILDSAGWKYTGPFAIEPDEENEGKYKIREGVVYAGGHRYNINEENNITPPANDYLYLVMSSGGGSVTSSYQNTYPGSTNPDMLVTRIGNVQGGTVTQIQFGDITCVPWGATGGGGIAYPDYNHGAACHVDTYYTTSSGGKTGYTSLSSQGGLILGTIQATSASAVGAYIQLMAGANEQLEQTFLQTVFNPDPSGTSEILLCVPIGPDTDFKIVYDNCMVSTEYSDTPGVHVSTLSFYPYTIKS